MAFGCSQLSLNAILFHKGARDAGTDGSRSRSQTGNREMRRLQGVQLRRRSAVYASGRGMARRLQEVLLQFPDLYRHGILSPHATGCPLSTQGNFLHRLQPSGREPGFPRNHVGPRGHLLRDLRRLQANVP